MNDTNIRLSTRKKAAIACDYCRKRKRRCDGKQPICTLCRRSNQTMCHYEINLPTQPEDGTSTNAGTTVPDISVKSRIAQLEEAIEEHSVAMDTMKTQLAQLMTTTHTSGLDDDSLSTCTPATIVHLTNACPGGSASSQINDMIPMTIPLGHGSTSEDLLHAQNVKLLLGHHPKDMFLKREQKRELPEEFSLRLDTWAGMPALSLEEAAAAELVNVYFSEVNPRFPILDQETFHDIFNSTDLRGGMDTKVALVLMVLALGSVSQELPDKIKDGILPEARFSRPSIQFLLREWPLHCRTDAHLCQALFLAASWYNYLCRPLQAWRMIHMASTNIQHVFFESDGRGANVSQDLIRLCWAIFLVECDILAEYHLPRSGIENVMERLQYPECGPQSLDHHLLSWLGNLSARRLMNRVHFSLYNTTSSDGDGRYGQVLDELLDSPNANVLFATTAELNHQLNMWWDLLPSPIKPDLGSSDPSANQGDLILRFWACGDIIFRPFLYKVCSMPQGLVPEKALVEPALSCIHHCRQFLRLASSATKQPSPFTMINLHSTLAVIINLTVASLCPFLAEYVSDIGELERMAVSILNRWAIKGSSIEIILRIAIALSDKRQMVGSFS